MTDVGKIKLGVEIDAGDLSAKLGEAVRRAIAPALAEIQRELNKVQQEYDKTATHAEKSAAKQVAANKLVERSLHDVERQALKTAAAMRSIPNHPGGGPGSGGPGGGGGGGGFGGKTTYNIDRRTYTYHQNKYDYRTITTHRTNNSVKNDHRVHNDHRQYHSTTIKYDQRQMPPGAGPGGGGDSRRGGVLGFLTSPLGLNAVALGAQALPAALTGVTNLVGAVQQLGQAGLVLPAIYGAAAASIGTAVIGFKGMGDAVKELNEAAESGDYSKVDKLFKKMAPEAIETAKAVSELSRGPLTDLKKSVQGHMFKDIAADMRSFTKRELPGVQNGMNQIGDSWNDTMKTLMSSLSRQRDPGSGTTMSLVDHFLGNTAEGQRRANRAIDPITHALATVMATGSDFLPRLGDALAKVADRFDTFISKAGQSGQLWKWIDEGLNGLRSLGNAVLNIGKTLTGLTKAAGGDNGFLGWLERATGKMQAFVNSTHGQEVLQGFFKKGHEDLNKWGDLLSKLAPVLLQIIQGFAQWGEVMFPIIKAFADLVGYLNQVPGLVAGMVTALVGLRTVSGIVGKLGGKGAIGAGGLIGGGKTMGALAGGAAALTGWNTETNARTGWGQLAGAAEMIGGGALAGAAIGSAVPVVGTAAGALIGGGAGAVASVLAHFQNDINRDAQSEAEARARSAAQAERQNIAMAAMKDAQIGINNSLIDSGGKIDAGVIAGVGDKIKAIPDSLGAMDPSVIEEVRKNLQALNIDQQKFATIVANGGAPLDALMLRLREMGPSGAIAAQQLQQINAATQGAAQAAAQANPALQAVANAFTGGNLGQAATNIQQIFAALRDGPVNANMAGVSGPGGLLDILHQLKIETSTDQGGFIQIRGNVDPQILQTLQEITGKVVTINQQGQLQIQTSTAQGQLQVIDSQMQGILNMMRQLQTGPPIQIPNVNQPTPLPIPGQRTNLPPGFPEPPRASGGIVRGFAGGGVFRRGFDIGGVMVENGPLPPGWGTLSLPPGAAPWLAQMWPYLDDAQRAAMLWQAGLRQPSGQFNPGVLLDTSMVTSTARATGGMLPGYSPGVDNMLVPLSGGEGIIIPEAMRALGPDWLYNLNSRFRGGLSRAGYASGGVYGYDDGGVHSLPGDNSVIGLLTQIRDLLAGRGTGANGPLSNMANNTQQMASGLSPGSMAGGGYGGGGMLGGTTPGRIGPFGTPIPARNHGWEMMAAAIQALGGQPELFIGPNPATYAGGGYGGGYGMPGAGGGGRMPIDPSTYITALSAFARSGNLSDVTGMGLDANDSIVSAIVTARNKKKGGMTDDQIADLVSQVLGGGGYTGAMTEQNSALVRALQSFREKLAKGGGGGAGGAAGGMPGMLGMAGMGAAGMTGNANALIAFAQAASGGKYAAASDLVHGLADCSGAVSDLVEFVTKGRAGPERLFSTANEAQVLQSLGATHGLVPGGLQIGISPAHTAATLPNGMNFESGGSGGGVVYGGKVGAADAQFTDHWTLPVDGAGFGVPGMPGGMSPMSMGGGFGAGGGIQQVYVVNMPGAGFGGPAGEQALGMAAGVAMPGIGAAAGAGGQALTDAIKGVSISGLTGTRMATPTAQTTALSTLLHERNPMALAAMFGVPVADFTRAGGGAGAGQIQRAGGYDATGRLFSDTGALMQRTFTDLNSQFDAMRSQTVGVMESVKGRLEDKALTPIMTQGVTAGFSAINPGTFNTMGGGLGVGAAPPIAAAVGDAVASLPIQSQSPGLDPMAGIGTVFGLAGGGPVSGGTPGKDSVPALLMPDEFVLNTMDVARMGGAAGVERFRSALARGSLRRFAAGGTVGSGKRIGNDEVGADFFGVSEIPIIGTIINLLIRVLLKVIGLDIEVRDTMLNLGKDFRQFRGDAFQAFDAQGRLLNDTSALIDRSSTSAETAADERIRILKLVIEALIKYIIEKVIVPVTKAIANAALQGVASAAGMAINSQAPGAGSVASAFITSLGQAGIEIGAEVGTDFALALSSTLIDVVAEGLVSLLPDLMQTVFSGGLLAMLFNPIGNLLTTILGGFMGTLTAIFGGLFGGAATLIPGIPFDSGGMAHGVGFLPKATMDDELVLSPGETDLFSRFVGALERGGFGSGSRTVNAPITVMGGGPETPKQIQDRLVRAMP